MKKDRRDIKKMNNKVIGDRESIKNNIQNDDFKYIKNEIRNSIEKDIGKNNSKDSLESYDESMTINAVGRLLNKSSKSSSESQMSASQAIKTAFAPDFNKEFNKNERKEDHREGLYNSRSDYTDTIKLSNLSIPKSKKERPELESPSRRKLSEPSASYSSKISDKVPERIDRPERLSNKLPPNTSSRASSLTNKYSGVNYDDFEDPDYEEQVEDEITPVSALRVVVFSSFLLLLCILVFLVLRINEVTRQLDRIQAGTFPAQNSTEVEALISQNDNLSQQIIALENEITSLQQQMSGLEIPIPAPTSQNNYINAQDQPILQAQPIETSEPRTHVVQPGQSLSSLSSQFFGSPAEYYRIVEANNLQTTELQIGQVLIIPE